MLTGKKIYRSVEQSVLVALVGIVGAGTVAFSPFANPHSWGNRLGFVLLALAMLYLVVGRIARSHVEVDAQGIRIRNPLKTTELPWKDVSGFALGRYGPFPLMGHVLLVSGMSLHVFGIQAPNRFLRRNSRSAEAIIGALNAELLRLRDAHMR